MLQALPVGGTEKRGTVLGASVPVGVGTSQEYPVQADKVGELQLGAILVDGVLFHPFRVFHVPTNTTPTGAGTVTYIMCQTLF